MTRAFAIALTGLLYLPMTSQAQTDYEEQVRDFLETSGRMMLEPQGFLATYEVYTGSLKADADDDHWITLDGGEEYALLGVCDEDCEDIDLYLYDEKGNEIDSDAASDDFPIVLVYPSSRTRYRVQVNMYSCEVEPCYYAVGLYQGGGVVADPDDYQGQADHYLQTAYDALLAGDKYRLEESLYGDLDSSDDETFQVELQSGRPYTILGACDDDCEDMDLFLMDRNGNELASDTEVDSFPLVSITPSYTGTFQVRVKMYDCTLEPCFYSVGVYRR